MLLNVLTVSGVKDVIARAIVKTTQCVTGQQEPACVTAKVVGWEMNVTNVRHFSKCIKFSEKTFSSGIRNWVERPRNMKFTRSSLVAIFS